MSVKAVLDGAQAAAEALKRAAAEAAQRAAAEAAQRAAAQAALKATAEALARKGAETTSTVTQPATQQSSFQASNTQRRTLDLGGGEVPQATNLATEDRTDGSVNCLDVVGDFLILASPEIRARSEVLFLQDTRAGAEGLSGHVIIRQGDRIFDPATRSWMDSATWFRQHPEYQLAGTLSGTVAARILSMPPGPDRLTAMERAGVPASIGTMMVADVGAPPPMSPAVRAAMDVYLAAPTPENFDALVLALAMDQATTAQSELQAMRDRLAADPGALTGLQMAASEARTMAAYYTASFQIPFMPERFLSLQQQLQSVDPSWANVTFDQLTQDPALYSRFLADLDTLLMAPYGDGPLPPQGPNPPLAAEIQTFRATMDVLMGPPHVAGVPLSQSVTRAEQQLAYIRMQHPELAALDMDALLMARSASEVIAQIDTRLSEVSGLMAALRSDNPGAADMLPVAMMAVQLVGSEMMANPSVESIEAFDAAFNRVQEIEQARVGQVVRDLALAGLSLVIGVGATVATGGLALFLYGASIAGGVVSAGLALDQYMTDRRLSQYNIGGSLDFSGVQQPSDFLLALNLGLTAVGVKFDLDGMAGVLRAMSLTDEGARLLAAADTAITVANAGRGGPYFDEIANAGSFDELSEGARSLLAEWGIRSDAYYAANGATHMSDDALLKVFQQSHGQGRSVMDAYRAGAITDEELVMWYTRGSSVAEAGQIVMSNAPNIATTATRSPDGFSVSATVNGNQAGTLTMTVTNRMRRPMGVVEMYSNSPIAQWLVAEEAAGRTFQTVGLSDISVGTDYQGMGVASSMLDEAFAWAREQGADFIAGAFSEDGMRALRNYCQNRGIPFFSVPEGATSGAAVIYIGALP